MISENKFVEFRWWTVYLIYVYQYRSFAFSFFYYVYCLFLFRFIRFVKTLISEQVPLVKFWLVVASHHWVLLGWPSLVIFCPSPIVLRTILDKINTNTTNMSKSSFSHLFIPLSLSSILIGTQAIHTEHNFSQLTGEGTEAYRMWYTDRVSIIYSEISLDFWSKCKHDPASTTIVYKYRELVD